MKRRIRTIVSLAACFILVIGLLAPVAVAGVYTDELSKCLVRSTPEEDRVLLVTWMFSTIALHPAVSEMADVTDAERAVLSESYAKLVERLLTENCAKEAREALQYEGGASFEASFNVLGQVAARNLFGHPAVAAAMMDFASHLDQERMEQVLSGDADGSDPELPDEGDNPAQ
jgi:hypothetical protein